MRSLTRRQSQRPWLILNVGQKMKRLMSFYARREHTPKQKAAFVEWLTAETTQLFAKSAGDAEGLKSCVFLGANRAHDAGLTSKEYWCVDRPRVPFSFGRKHRIRLARSSRSHRRRRSRRSRKVEAVVEILDVMKTPNKAPEPTTGLILKR